MELLIFLQTGNLINYIYGLFVLILFCTIAIVVVLYGVFKGKSEVHDSIIQPYKDAAEGWKLAAEEHKEKTERLSEKVTELENKIEIGLRERTQLMAEREELKNDLIYAAKSNFRLQGAVDKLTERVASLENKDSRK